MSTISKVTLPWTPSNTWFLGLKRVSGQQFKVCEAFFVVMSTWSFHDSLLLRCTATYFADGTVLSLTPGCEVYILLSLALFFFVIRLCDTSVSVHRYHGNNVNGDVGCGNFFHQSSNFSLPLLVHFASNFEIVSQNYAL